VPARTFTSDLPGPDQATTQTDIRSRFDYYGKILGIARLDDWYKAGTKAKLKAAGAPATLYQIKGGVKQALQTAYPEHHWQSWKFERPLWTLETQRQFLEHLAATKLNIQSLDGWYKVKSADVISKGGSGLLQGYGGSLIAALQAVYPDHEWQEWRFKQIPGLLWQDPKNITRFFDWLGKELRITTVEDWYQIHPSLLTEGKGTHFFGPRNPWKNSKLTKSVSSSCSVEYLAAILRWFFDQRAYCSVPIAFVATLEI
jgi:hypothetical protein